MNESRDVAMVIAWPDVTARGDEKWMAVLKSLGVVKNLNFKVGHAAIILIQRTTGALAYYDFGRYITPRGYGRARSASSDPRLSLHTRAQFTATGSLSNIPTITAELHEKEYATHGGGRMYFSIATGISYKKAVAFANQLVNQGPVKYGAIANGNNSCSRFVAQTLLAGMPSTHPAARHLLFPESGKPSPMSNVINAIPNRTIHCWQHGKISTQVISRWQSLRFQANLLLHNLSASKARLLPCDQTPGNIAEPTRPHHLPPDAQWLGGIGEGAWFVLEKNSDTNTYQVIKYASQGTEEYRINCSSAQTINLFLPYQFTYHFHHQWYVIRQGNHKITLRATDTALAPKAQTSKTA